MPNGFRGTPTANYLNDVDGTLSTSKNLHNQNPLAGLSGHVVPLPTLPNRNNQNTPHPPETARSGGNSTGTNTSNNVVVDQSQYDALMRQIDRVDDRAGEQLYNISLEIEQMCRTSYIVPKTVPRVLLITSAIKNSMGNFRTLTADTATRIRNFARDILGVS